MSKEKKKASTALAKGERVRTHERLATLEDRVDRMERVGGERPPHSEEGGIFALPLVMEGRAQQDLADWAGQVFSALSSLDPPEREEALAALEDGKTVDWLHRSQVASHHVAEAAALGPASRLNIVNWLRSEHAVEDETGTRSYVRVMDLPHDQIREMAANHLQSRFPGGPLVTPNLLAWLAQVPHGLYAEWRERTWAQGAPEPVDVVLAAARALHDSSASRASIDG